MYDDNLPPGTTQEQAEWTPYLDYAETLEALDNRWAYKSDYMVLIQRIIYDNWLSANDSETLINAIYWYSEAK